MHEIYDVVTTKNPVQLESEPALWTRAMVRELIGERFNVYLSDASVGRLLRKMGRNMQRDATGTATKGLPARPGESGSL